MLEFEYKTQSTLYYCQKIKLEVNTSSRILMLCNSDIERVVQGVRISFDCDKKFKCKISKDSCNLISFNWNDCINPQCVQARKNRWTINHK